MHIPDGYLSPATCMVFGAVMIPIWAAASKTVKKTLSVRQVPYLAIGAAFSFVIAFPKNNSGRDVMNDSPSEIAQRQLDELFLSLVTPKGKN